MAEMLKAKNTNTTIIKLEDFFDAKTAYLDRVLDWMNTQSYRGYEKAVEQVKTIKANKTKFLSISRQALTTSLGVKVAEGNLIIENTNNVINATERRMWTLQMGHL